MAIAVTDTARGSAELVRRAYAAFATGDLVVLAGLFDRECSWHTPGRSAIAGDYLGRDAVLAQLVRYGRVARAELRSVAATDDGPVVAVHRATGERNGRRLDARCCVIFEIADARIVDAREHVFDLHAWDAFWS